MKKFLKWSILSLLTFLFSIFVFVCLVLLIFWVSPETLINHKSLKWVQTQFFPEYQVEWDKIHIDVDTLGIGKYRLVFEGRDFCANLNIYGEACFDELILELQTELSFNQIKALTIPRLIALDQKIHLTIPPADPNAAEEPLDLDQLKEDLKSYQRLWRRLQVQILRVELDQTQIDANERKFDLKLKAQNEGSLEQFEFEIAPIVKGEPLSAKGLLSQNTDEKSWTLALEAETPWLDARLRSQLNSPEGKFLVISGDLESDFKDKAIKSWAENFRGHIQLQVSQEDVMFRLRPLNLKLSKPPLKSVAVTLCEAHVSLAEENREGLKFKCDHIATRFDFNHSSLAKFKNRIKDLPEILTFHVQGQIPQSWIETSPLESEDLMKFSLRADPVNHELAQLNFEFATLFGFSNQKMRLDETNVKASLELKSFQSLVKRLSGTAFAVPAPFNVMKGSAKVEVVEMPRRHEGRLDLPLQAQVQLTSERNSVVGSTKGRFVYFLPPSKKIPELDLDVDLKKFHIQLPPFDPIRGFPPLTLDSRIQKQLDVTKKPSSVPLKLRVNLTGSGDAIRIYHQMLKPYAQFSLNAKVGQDTSFAVQKAPPPFDINYLKRSVTVQNLKVSQAGSQKPTMVNGRLLYKATGYDIFIEFSGSLEQPTVVLTSNPPLDRGDIISMILYNRLSQDITSFEQENVGGTQAALADRALGIFGLWAFASTPIESVSYNSVTKTYSAQVKLPEGFRLSIGTNWETVQNLELKRHLGGNWLISTIYRPQSEDGEGTGEIMLQRKTSY